MFAENDFPATPSEWKRFLAKGFSGGKGRRMNSLPVVLSIAGSDNSAGAGIQADLKTFSALGVYGTTALSCVVAEVPGKVSAISPLAPDMVAAQIRVLMEAFPIRALKTGMLYSAEILEAVCEVLEEERLKKGALPALVVDPVMVATSGDLLMEAPALEAYRSRLFALAMVLTPNLDEISVLVGQRVESREQMVEAGRRLVREFGVAVLVKGGHLREAMAADVLVGVSGDLEWYEAPYVEGVSTHGTGCTYSAAIVAGLARGLTLPEAVGEAKAYLTRCIREFLRWERAGGAGGGTVDALHHFAVRE